MSLDNIIDMDACMDVQQHDSEQSGSMLFSIYTPDTQAKNLEKCRSLMHKMIESGDIAVPALYPGEVK